MNIQEKIDRLMHNVGLKSYRQLLIKIYQQIGDNNLAYEKAEKEKGNFTKMLKGERELNSKYYIPLEKIFNIRIADLLSDNRFVNPTFRNSGLRYTAASNSYEEFKNLNSETTQEGDSPIFNTDEYDKSIYDYIVEYRAGNGIKYFVNECSLRYNCLTKSFFSPNTNSFCDENTIDKIADVLFEIDDGDTFSKLFYAYDMLASDYNDERNIYNKESFLKRILDSSNIFNKYLSKKECAISEMNYARQNDNRTGIFINPILNRLLVLAIEDPKKYADKILNLLDYGIKNNPDVISVAVQCDDSDVHTFAVKENGGVDLKYTVCGCLIVIKDDYINTNITSEMKSKMLRIKEINNQILMIDKEYIMGMKRVQKNELGNVIKLHTNNSVEYEMYDNVKNKKLPIAELLGIKDGVDEFATYVGENTWHKYSNEMIVDVAKFLKIFHQLFAQTLNDKVYVHGNLTSENLYFTGNKLTCVVNWDNCRIGECYEDLAELIIKFSDVTDKFRINTDVLNRIKLILDTYGADKKIRKQVLEHIKEPILKKKLPLDLSDEQYIKEYEAMKWCEIFFDIYSKQLTEV